MPTPLAIVTASGWKGTIATDTRVCCGELGCTTRESAAAESAITCSRSAQLSACPAASLR